MDNTKILVKIGETGVVVIATMKDTNPTTGVLEAFSLDGWTVTMTAQKQGTTILDELACTPDPDQVANKGKVSCTFDATTADHPNLKKGIYDLEFEATDPSGDTHYFPKKFARRYATIEFENALS